MRTIFALLLIGLILLPPVSASADSPRGIKVIKDLTHENRNIGTYRALLIGINDYQDDQIPDLKTAKNDALAVAELLQAHYGFKIDSR